MGSPPRGRGKVQSSFLLPDIYGITPAWAGKSTVVLPTPGYLWDHPRVGGEKLVFHVGQRGQRGSPPRGRGKGRPPCTVQTIQRITPAWAGKRRNRGCCAAGKGDHPRVGGEKRCSGNTRIRPRGSPPRGRGKVSCLFPPWPLNGITPAWAGKSWAATRTRYRTWDHPRVGGEKPNRILWDNFKRGSPPRGRGKVALAHVTALALGITPAWAGKSCIALRRSARCGDHPRVGGEKCRCTIPG